MPDSRQANAAIPPRTRRHWGRWTVLGVLLAALLIALWLVATGSGRDLVLKQVAAQLPVTWSRAEGVLVGTLTLHDVHYTQTLESGALDIRSQRLAFNLALWPLLRGQIRLHSLALETTTLDLPPPADTAFTLPEWGDVLPGVELSLTIGVDTLSVRNLGIRQNGISLVEIETAHGGVLARAGEVWVNGLTIHSNHGRFWLEGAYLPGQNYRTHLTAHARLPAGARFGLALRGDLDALDIALAGFTPAPVKAQWTLRGSEWSLSADADAFNPGIFTQTRAAPVDFKINANGSRRESHWQGRFKQGDLAAILHPFTLHLADQHLELQEFDLELATGADIHGHLLASGHADFSADTSPQFALNLKTRNFSLSQSAPVIGLEATLEIAGAFAHWQAQGEARITRDGTQATAILDGQGDASGVALTSINAKTPGGQLKASGQLTWAPALGWDLNGVLDGVDPGYFLRDWPGTVRGHLTSRAHTNADNTLLIALDLPDLRGQLREKPLAATLHARAELPARGAPRLESSLDFRLGQSQLALTLNAREHIDLDARLSPLNLADLVPEASGQLQGRLYLEGARNAPDIEVDLSARALSYAGWRAQSLTLNGTLPWARGNGELQMDARGIDVDDNPAGEIEHLRLTTTGTVERLNLTGEIRSALGSLALDASSHWQAHTWRANITRLDLVPAQGPAWQLQSPLDLTRSTTRRQAQWQLGHACMGANNAGSICARADWPKDGLELDVNALPLSLFSPLLAAEALDTPTLTGEINLNATLRPLTRGWQGEIRLRSMEGGLTAAAAPVLGYRNLALDLDLTREHLHAHFSAALPAADATTEPGQLAAELKTGWDEHAPLSGHLSLDMPTLTWLELISGDLAAPGGHLSSRLHLGGTRAAPSFSGRADLTDLTSELPALGLRLDAGEIHLTAASDAPARVYGQVRSGEGILSLNGRLDWHKPGFPLALHLTGDNVLASNTRDVKLTIAPDLTIETAAKQPIRVTGRVGVPSALLELERLHSGESPSPDVVVLDPANPDAGRERTAVSMVVTLALGKDVRLRGFGLDGHLGGDLRVNAEPGRELSASGRLNVTGGYKAYGQALTITRGFIQFTNGPMDDPLVEMTAERKIETEDMTAGLTVTGRASAPEVSVWTTPATDNSEALSWLAFGRSMASLTKLESQQFDTAAAALTAGGNLLAGQIGRKLGLDEAGISTSRTLGQSVLGIGKQISPRLYVGVGISMVGTGQVLTLKYLLRKGFDIELETSTAESRSSVNWRHESD